MPTTPPSVRLALPVEARAIARLQRAAWVADHDDAMARALCASIDEEGAAQAWRQAVVAPPLARFRVLVATDGERPVGYAALGPSDDPDADPTDGQVVELVVDPALRGRGHGSRLMHAIVDTLRADGSRVARMWLPASFTGLRTFLEAHQFAADGAQQEVEDDAGQRLALVRLTAALD